MSHIRFLGNLFFVVTLFDEFISDPDVFNLSLDQLNDLNLMLDEANQELALKNSRSDLSSRSEIQSRSELPTPRTSHEETDQRNSNHTNTDLKN